MITKRFPEVRVQQFYETSSSAFVEFDGFKGPVTVELDLLRIAPDERSEHLIDVQDGVLVLGGKPLAFLEHTIETDRLAAELATSDDKRIANAARLGTFWRPMSTPDFQNAFRFEDAAAIYGLEFVMNKDGHSVKSGTLHGKKLPKAEAVSLHAAFRNADAKVHYHDGRLESVIVKGLPRKLEYGLRDAIEARLSA